MIGDINGDGVADIATGVDSMTTCTLRGYVRLNLMKANGVEIDTSYPLIGTAGTVGGFPYVLTSDAAFGSALCSPGDLDGDGINELIVGAPGDDGDRRVKYFELGDAIDINHGAIYVIFFKSDGTMREYQKVSNEAGNLGIELQDQDKFGA